MFIRARAPLRLSFAGGGTDVSPYCDTYGGMVFNATIDKYAYATIETDNSGRASFVSAEREEKWEGETGFVHLSVDKYLETTNRRQAFLCGPPPMINAVMQILGDKGMNPEDIFFDKF